MNRRTFEFGIGDLNLTVVQIEQLLGYKEGESHEVIAEMISDSLDQAGRICQIKSEYTLFTGVRLLDSEKSIGINNIVFNVNKIVYGQLKRSDSIAVFLGTAGEEIGIRSRKSMNDGDLLAGYIYDVIGSVIADGAAALMQEQLEIDMAAEQKKITNRYSPGYCKWDVSEQHKLFSLIPGNFCGITLNGSALMHPEKSVSGFIGTGKDVRHNPYTCSLCEMKQCIYRREKAD